MTTERTYTDEQLATVVASSVNWHEVMRALGLPTKSAFKVRTVRRLAADLSLDTSHFRGKRRWSDSQLRRAVIESFTWDEVLTALGISPGPTENRTRVKGQAIRLGLDISHIGRTQGDGATPEISPGLAHLRDAGESIAATWFTFCGCHVSWPLTPAAYDLVVAMPDGIKRVQVKTTTKRAARDGWQAQVGHRPYSVGNRAPQIPYEPDEIDLFFIIDGDLNIYLIPNHVIAGRVSISLRLYVNYIVGSFDGLMGKQPAA
jgi:hypothetical protein